MIRTQIVNDKLTPFAPSARAKDWSERRESINVCCAALLQMGQQTQGNLDEVAKYINEINTLYTLDLVSG